jgi:hypothetical protein
LEGRKVSENKEGEDRLNFGEEQFKAGGSDIVA